jgi:hypothetical protein
MAQDKSSFLLYCDIIHTVNKLPDEKAGRLFKHILAYVNDQNPDTDDLLIELAFEPIKQALKRDLKKYEKRCVKNTENVRKRWNKTNTTVYDRIRTNTKHTDIDIDIDIESDIESERDITLPPTPIPSSKTNNMEAVAQMMEDPNFQPEYLSPYAQADALLDLFKARYSARHDKAYIARKWDHKTLVDLAKANGFKIVQDSILQYMALERNHNVNDFGNGIGDGWPERGGKAEPRQRREKLF